MNPTKNADPKPQFALVGVGTQGHYVVMRLPDNTYFTPDPDEAFAFRYANVQAAARAANILSDFRYHSAGNWVPNLVKPEPAYTYKFVEIYQEGTEVRYLERSDGKLMAYHGILQTMHSARQNADNVVTSNPRCDWVDKPEPTYKLVLTRTEMRILTELVGRTFAFGPSAKLFSKLRTSMPDFKHPVERGDNVINLSYLNL